MDTLEHKSSERYTHASDQMQKDAAGTIARQLFPALDTTTSGGEEAKSG